MSVCVCVCDGEGQIGFLSSTEEELEEHNKHEKRIEKMLNSKQISDNESADSIAKCLSNKNESESSTKKADNEDTNSVEIEIDDDKGYMSLADNYTKDYPKNAVYQKRKDSDTLLRIDPRIVKIPKLGPLVFWIPAMEFVSEGKHSLFCTRFFFVPACATEGRIESVQIQRLFERVRLHDFGVLFAVLTRVNSQFEPLMIDVNNQFDTQLIFDVVVAELDHLLEFPSRIDMQKRKWRLGWIERFERQVRHDRRVLAHGVEHDGLLKFRSHLSNNVDALGFQLLKVR